VGGSPVLPSIAQDSTGEPVPVSDPGPGRAKRLSSGERMEVVLAGAPDQNRWDDYVERHPGATPYHFFAWKTAVESAYGHRGHYLLGSEEERVVGVLPLVAMRSPLGRKTLVSLPFCDAGGALCDTEQTRSELEGEALSLGRNTGALVELRESGSGKEGASGDKVRMVLPLPGSSEQLWNSFSSKLRSQVRKAEKNGLAFRWGGARDVGSFYRVFARNMRDLGSPVHSRTWVSEVLRAFGDRARMGLVFLGEEPVGCGIVLRTHCTAAIPWASTLREHNRLAPNMLLYWRLLEWAADQDLALFDFGRSTPGEGTFRFKEQWGAKPQPLLWRIAAKNGEWKGRRAQTTRARDFVAAVWSRLPLGVATRLGPSVRRHISL
jgi:FemAB-related protein (PEP-CTERM system-associated)